MKCWTDPSYHDVVYTEALGAAAYIARCRVVPLRNTGSAILRLVNIGDAKLLACHPASTTYRQLNEEELKKAGVSADLVRIAGVG